MLADAGLLSDVREPATYSAKGLLMDCVRNVKQINFSLQPIQIPRIG